MPFGLLLLCIYGYAMRKAIFYEAGNREVRRSGIRRYHYVLYMAFLLFFGWAIITPFTPRMNERIAAFFALHNGHGNRFLYYTGDAEELSKGLPDGEFISGYVTLRSVKPDELVNEIIPGIINYQRRFQEWLPHSSFEGYNLGGDFKLEYDMKNDKFLLWLDRELAGEILVKDRWFLKEIYVHYYRDVMLK